MPTNLENSAVATGLEMVSFHSNVNESSKYHKIALIREGKPKSQPFAKKEKINQRKRLETTGKDLQLKTQGRNHNEIDRKGRLLI